MKTIYKNYFKKNDSLNPVLEALKHIPIFNNLYNKELKEVAKLVHERVIKQTNISLKKWLPQKVCMRY